MDNDFTGKVKALNDTPDFTEEFKTKDINNNKLMAILAYCSWLVLVPLFAAKDSRFARFHTNQGLILVVLETVWWIISAVLGGVFWPLRILFWLGDVVIVVLIVLGIVNVANGKAKELPVIGKFRLINY